MSNNNLFAIYNGTQLTSVNGLSILMTDPYKQPKRKLSILALARANKSKVNSAFYNQKIITVRVAINRTTRDALEQSIDDLNKILQPIEKELWLQQSGGVRKYTCTLQDIAVSSSGGAYWEADLLFVCSDNYGYDTSYTTIVNLSGVTSSSRTDQYGFTGSAEYQTPFIEIQFTSAPGASGTVIVGNLANGQQISVTRAWSSGDLLQIDSQNETVKVNGLEVAFTGAFPRFVTGVGNLTYSDNLASRTIRYLAYYYKRWV